MQATSGHKDELTTALGSPEPADSDVGSLEMEQQQLERRLRTCGRRLAEQTQQAAWATRLLHELACRRAALGAIGNSSAGELIAEFEELRQQLGHARIKAAKAEAARAEGQFRLDELQSQLLQQIEVAARRSEPIQEFRTLNEPGAQHEERTTLLEAQGERNGAVARARDIEAAWRSGRSTWSVQQKGQELLHAQLKRAATDHSRELAALRAEQSQKIEALRFDLGQARARLAHLQQQLEQQQAARSNEKLETIELLRRLRALLAGIDAGDQSQPAQIKKG